jgi:Family of unknown function (DUF5329)
MGRMRKVSVALALLGSTLGLHAALPTEPQAEIAYLLGFVEASGCDFYRNGTRYSAMQAGSHLRQKYAVLMSSGKPATTEAFIDKVATRSSLTGVPYEVTCTGAARVGTAAWLREELARYRTKRAGSVGPGPPD